MADRFAKEWYENNAAEYADSNPDLPIRKWVEWPAVRSLLPEVSGLRVLDAGCGDGTYSRRLADAGAEVIGVDFSEDLLSIAEEEHGDAVRFERADLREPLTFLDGGSIDLIVSQLVLDHVEEWGPVFREFRRVLAPEGRVVISVSHPPTIWAKIDRAEGGEIDLDDPSYFETEPWHVEWPSGDEGPSAVRKYRRPLTVQVNAAFDAGFVMDGLREAKPTEKFEAADPETYDRWIDRPPTFICYRFRTLPEADGP